MKADQAVKSASAGTVQLLTGVGAGALLVFCLHGGGKPVFSESLVLLILGGLLLEFRAVQPGQVGLLSCAGAAYLAALVVPTLGVAVGAFTAALGVALRAASVAEKGEGERLRSALADLVPLLVAGTVCLVLLEQELPPARLILAVVLSFLASGELVLKLLYRSHREARAIRRRFLAANAIASVPLAATLESAPTSALFLFPLLLIVQQGGYGVAMTQRREQLVAITEKLKKARQEVRNASQVSRQKSQEVRSKESHRRLLEDFSVFFSRNPSPDAILQNMVSALEHLLQPKGLWVFFHKEGRFQVRCHSKGEAQAEAWREGVRDPWLTRCLSQSSLLELGSGQPEVGESPVFKAVGPGLAIPLPRYGAVFAAGAGEVTERRAELLLTITSQVSLGLDSAIYRERLNRALGQRTQALEQLRESQAQLVQSGKMAAVGQLAAGVAHELNSPLAAVLLQLQAGQMRLEGGKLDKARKSLEVAERATNTAQRIIDKLLAFSHMSEQERIVLPLQELFQATLEVVEPQFCKAGLALEVQDPGSLAVVGDPLELQQVLTNLLLNARDAALANKDRRPPLVEIKALSKGDMVHLLVRDSGAGVPEEVSGRIFEPFFTTKEIGEGTGLGLSLSYQIAEAHGGSLDFVNTQNGGAEFRLRLPAA